MPDKSEVIMGQMEDTRKGLTDKLEKLEEKISGTVDTVSDTVATVTESVESVKDSIQETVSAVTDTVQNTVQSVTSSVGETVETVKESVASFLDVPAHVRNHPWLMFGGSVLAGFLGGRMILPRTREKSTPQAPTYAASSVAGHAPAYTPPPEPRREERRPEAREAPEAHGESWVGRLAQQFAPQLNHLKGLAIGALLGTVRDMAEKAVPETLRREVTDVINGFTSDLGGQVIRGPVLGTSDGGTHGHEEPRGQTGTGKEAEAVGATAPSTTRQGARAGGRR